MRGDTDGMARDLAEAGVSSRRWASPAATTTRGRSEQHLSPRLGPGSLVV